MRRHTVFTPFSQFQVPPTASVGVIAIGGLGHLALKFARAWGCEVTASTSTGAKQDEALRLGAHRALNSRDADNIASISGRLDLLRHVTESSFSADLQARQENGP